jgi:hypothetical protein
MIKPDCLSSIHGLPGAHDGEYFKLSMASGFIHNGHRAVHDLRLLGLLNVLDYGAGKRPWIRGVNRRSSVDERSPGRDRLWRNSQEDWISWKCDSCIVKSMVSRHFPMLGSVS